ncbi:Pyoverdine/dityrosine biosynthesis protein-domain-containing protein [Aspergillus nidulans var. acristatus]
MYINVGTSVYHHVAAIYQRDRTGNLLSADGRYANQIRSLWGEIYQTILDQDPSEVSELRSGRSIRTTQITLSLTSSEGQTVLIHELQEINTSIIRGLLTFTPSSSLSSNFFAWARTYLLLNSRLLTTSPSNPEPKNPAHLSLAEEITTLFATTLKNTSQDDRWHLTGREYFIDRVYLFIKDNKKIEFCLPAFPCKSSNPDKVAGVVPDAAEYLALEHLNKFVQRVGAIYEPGATLWVISDGHVFSDCIGVDDALVDSYGAILASQYKATTKNQPSSSNIQFTGLEDLFFSSPESTSSFSTDMLDSISIPQPIETVLTESAQKCRLLLDTVGGIDRNSLRGLIDRKHPETLALYQGQSRFMLEDLGAYLSERNIGSKARKRIASKVAEEMIARNHAYSNLVELLFPHHVRLSIHAHTNAGPKFGIRLFPRGAVRAAPTAQSLLSMSQSKSESESGAITNPLYEFQIPTPWHNCLVRVEGLKGVLLTRSGIIRDAISKGLFEGGWCQREGGPGGYFAIRRVKQEVAPAAAMEEVNLSTTQADTRTQTETKIEPTNMEPMYLLADKKSPLRMFGVFVWYQIIGFWTTIRSVVGTSR